MTTKAQKACYVIDHLVKALGNEASSSLRRALILVDIDQYPGTSLTGVMERLNIDKSTAKREIDWLFNYGCVTREGSETDGRAVTLQSCGYSKAALQDALDYFEGGHDKLKSFIRNFVKFLKQEKPDLRDAKIVALLYEKKNAPKNAILGSLYGGSSSTDNRAFNKLVEDGVVDNA